MTLKRLAGKVAVITGSSRGLGRATAQRLAAEGAHVVINYRSHEAEAQAVAAQITEAGGQASVVQGDLSTPAGVAAFFTAVDAALTARLGDRAFDILINNAGVIHTATIEDTREADLDRLFDLNVTGPWIDRWR